MEQFLCVLFVCLKTHLRTHLSIFFSKRYLKCHFLQLKVVCKSHLNLLRSLVTQNMHFPENLLKTKKKNKGRRPISNDSNDKTICLQELLTDDTRIYCSCLWVRSSHDTNWNICLCNSVFQFMLQRFSLKCLLSHKKPVMRLWSCQNVATGYRLGSSAGGSQLPSPRFKWFT